MHFFTKPYWSPYLSGILIGLLQIPIFLFLHASIGSSGAFNSVACCILHSFSKVEISTMYTKCFPLMKNWWQLGFVIGIFIGAYISSTISNTKKKNFCSPIWNKITNGSFRNRIVMAFGGGFIMLLGARIGDGCTSGNGISGIGLLSVGSMIVIASMFIGGILFARLYKKL